LIAIAGWCKVVVRQAFTDVIMLMWIAAVGYWVLGIGSGYIFGFEMGYGPQGIWWGLAFGLCVTGTLLTVRYVILSKFNRRVDENAIQA
jgi:MATE family multidrug resistance protein